MRENSFYCSFKKYFVKNILFVVFCEIETFKPEHRHCTEKKYIDKENTWLSKNYSIKLKLCMDKWKLLETMFIHQRQKIDPLFFLPQQMFLNQSKRKGKTELKRRWKQFITFWDNYNDICKTFLRFNNFLFFYD